MNTEFDKQQAAMRHAAAALAKMQAAGTPALYADQLVQHFGKDAALTYLRTVRAISDDLFQIAAHCIAVETHEAAVMAHAAKLSTHKFNLGA
jgi:hypothetical protein